MPGRTGKRAKTPAACALCHEKITGDFDRTKSGDFHRACWWMRYYPDSPHAKAEAKKN